MQTVLYDLYINLKIASDLPSQPFRDILSVICIVLGVDQCRHFITVLSIFKRYKTEMRDILHIVDLINMHMFKCIYRS